jgi:acetyl esterase/lipase
MTRLILLIVLATTLPVSSFAQARVEQNVVFGMYSGLALLMDVYRPAQPNGFGIVAIQGSGWYAPMRYDARPLKDTPEVATQAKALSGSGYTVFVINHRQTPRFRYPAHLEDVQRAVRYVRAHATEYGITPDRIGAWGSSSGGHLAELLGTLDGASDSSDDDPVNKLSAKVQAVVAYFAPADLTMAGGGGAISVLMGFAYRDPTVGPPPPRPGYEYVENRIYREASPITHVTADDAPMLLMHGDQDTVVPIKQSEIMEQALRKAGIAVKFIRVPGGNHGANFRLKPGDPRLLDHTGEAIRWFDVHLRRDAATRQPR